MTEKAYYLTEADVRLLRTLRGQAKNEIQNPSGRSPPNYDDQLGGHQAPEVYVARTPTEGISGLLLSADEQAVGTASASGTNINDTEDIVSYADCDIYRLSNVPNNQIVGTATGTGSEAEITILEQMLDQQQRVYNIYEEDIPGNTYITVEREKGGFWLAVPPAGDSSAYLIVTLATGANSFTIPTNVRTVFVFCPVLCATLTNFTGGTVGQTIHIVNVKSGTTYPFLLGTNFQTNVASGSLKIVGPGEGMTFVRAAAPSPTWTSADPAFHAALVRSDLPAGAVAGTTLTVNRKENTYYLDGAVFPTVDRTQSDCLTNPSVGDLLYVYNARTGGGEVNILHDTGLTPAAKGVARFFLPRQQNMHLQALEGAIFQYLPIYAAASGSGTGDEPYLPLGTAITNGTGTGSTDQLSFSVTLTRNSLLVVWVGSAVAGASAEPTNVTFDGVIMGACHRTNNVTSFASHCGIYSIHVNFPMTGEIVIHLPEPMTVLAAAAQIHIPNLSNYAENDTGAVGVTAPAFSPLSCLGIPRFYLASFLLWRSGTAPTTGAWGGGFTNGAQDISENAGALGKFLLSGGYLIPSTVGSYTANLIGSHQDEYTAAEVDFQ